MEWSHYELEAISNCEEVINSGKMSDILDKLDGWLV